MDLSGRQTKQWDYGQTVVIGQFCPHEREQVTPSEWLSGYEWLLFIELFDTRSNCVTGGRSGRINHQQSRILTF